MSTDLEKLEKNITILNEALKPYRRDWKRRERLSKLLEQIIRSASKEAHFRVDAMLTPKATQTLTDEPGLEGCSESLSFLKDRAVSAIRQYQIEFRDDLLRLAQDAEVTLEIDFPRFSGAKGINGEVDFGSLRTTINDKTFKSVDPARIVSALQKLERQLYGRPLDPQAFIDELFAVYTVTLARSGHPLGDPVPIQDFYLELVVSRQSKRFFRDMSKNAFKGYGVNMFSVDLWRLFQSEVRATSDGCRLQLRPGRNKALWLIDTDGEHRQITSISFLEVS